VIELAGGGYDTIETSVSYSIAALQVEALTAIGTGAIRLTGNARNNVITGNAAVNVIKGGAGADTMAGGNGNDVYYVGSRTDKVIEVAAGGTADRVVTTVSYALSANVEQLIATGKGWVDLTGNKLNNLITGNVSKNIINGGAGNDKINGGYGNDVLAGGTGKDIFIFKDKLNSRSNMDRIADFSVRDDTIQLDNAIFTKLGAGTPTAPRLLSEDYFIVGKAANDENDYIIYDNETGILYYDADGSGAGAAIAFAKIAVDLPLSRADFLVI
jgi:Ca2+-binding RTX toxin-like protein